MIALQRYWTLFTIALQFMTRIPVPQSSQSLTDEDYRQSVMTFPVVGAVIGLISVFVFLICQLWWGNLIAAVCAVLTSAMINGGFHLDGLADTADGVFSSRNREKMLEIMRDSRIGSNGVLALLFVVLLKITVIYQLAEQNSQAVLGLLIAAPALARALSVCVLMYKQSYARKSGLAHFYIGQITGRLATITLLTGLLIVVVFTGFHGFAYALVTWGFALLFRLFIQAKLGGQTGDTLGAGVELFDLVFLLFMLA